MMYRLIENINREAISNRWKNNEGAQFKFDNEKNEYRLIELTPDLQEYKVGRTQRNEANCPVVAKGFIAYLIHNWGKKEIDIYNTYYSSCFAKFEMCESKKPGSFQRNLNAEFYPLHCIQEKEFAAFSEKIHPYLTESEIELLKQFLSSYFKYIAQKNKISASQPEYSRKQKPEADETKLPKIIKEHFAFFLGNCPRRGKPILSSKSDFNKLIEWTTYFYQNNFEAPDIETPIQTVNTNDYCTQLAFLYLFDQLRKLGYHNQRTRAATIFNLWERSFADYRGYPEKNFWKVKHDNGNEVKKLMKIDY